LLFSIERIECVHAILWSILAAFADLCVVVLSGSGLFAAITGGRPCIRATGQGVVNVVESRRNGEELTVDGQQSVRIFYGWWVVLAAAVGLALSCGPITVGTFGVFLKPLSQQFGWSRGRISLAFSLFAIAAAVSAPIVGRLVDYAERDASYYRR
jgi:hypothetical protein